MLETVLDSIPVRVFWKDRDCVYLGCNQLFAQDAGVDSPVDMVGKTDHDMGWAEQAELYRADDRAVMESGIDKVGYEEPQTTPAGERIWLRTSKIPLRDQRGEVVGVLGTYEDITASKVAEEEQRHISRRSVRLRNEPGNSPIRCWRTRARVASWCSGSTSTTWSRK